MKTLYNSLAILISSIALISCASYTPYAYNDTYYTPGNDPVNQVKKDPREDFNKTNNISYDGSYENRYAEDERAENYPQSIYSNRYTDAERNENLQSQNQAIEQEYTEEYYDEEYAQTLQRIGSPVRSFNTYDPYQRDRILFTQDPFFMTPAVCGSSLFWDPFVPRTGFGIGWNSWNGWNAGFGVNVGFSNFGFGGFNTFYDPWNPWNPWNRPFGWNRWNDPFFGPFNNWGWGGNPYFAGYNQGFVNGFYNGNRFNAIDNNVNSNSNRRYYNTPRGNKGSKTYTNGTGRPARPTTKTQGLNDKSATPANNPLQRPERPTRTNRPTSSPSLSSPATKTPQQNSVRPNRPTSRPLSTTPEVKTPQQNSLREQNNTRPTTPPRYRSEKNINSYSQPKLNEQPRQPNSVRPSSPTPRGGSQARPNYSRPRQNSYNNQNERIQPRQPQRTQPQRVQPQRQTRPSINRSRPSYNRSTPRYTPPSTGGSRVSPSRSVPSRPSRPSRPR